MWISKLIFVMNLKNDNMLHVIIWIHETLMMFRVFIKYLSHHPITLLDIPYEMKWNNAWNTNEELMIMHNRMQWILTFRYHRLNIYDHAAKMIYHECLNIMFDMLMMMIDFSVSCINFLKCNVNKFVHWNYNDAQTYWNNDWNINVIMNDDSILCMQYFNLW